MRVLLVEDDRKAARLVSKGLHEAGFLVDVAHSGEEGDEMTAAVDYAIIVHPEPYQDNHDYLEHCLEVGKGKLKGTCLFFAGRPGSLDQMAALVKRHPGEIVTARIHAYAPERLPPFGKPELRVEIDRQRANDLGVKVTDMATALNTLVAEADTLF